MTHKDQRTSLLLVEARVGTRYVNQVDVVTLNYRVKHTLSPVPAELSLGSACPCGRRGLAFGETEETSDFLEYLITKGKGDRVQQMCPVFLPKFSNFIISTHF